MPPKRGLAASSTEDVPLTSSQPPNQKKTRFVEPADDPVNFADEVDSALENPSAKRKGRVKTEGYDSDSSDDGEGVVLSRKSGAGGEGGEEEDDDMFAMGDKEEQKAEASGKKSKEEYLRLGDIEGQEFAEDKSGSDYTESEDEPEDEDEAERRRKAGMGYELSSFNMRDEMEEGKFSADGTYVRSFDPHGVHDRWLEDVDEREIKKARRRKRHQEKVEKERRKEEERELERVGGKQAMEKELLGMLKKGETVLEALQRLGAQAKKAKANNKGPKRKAEEIPVVNGTGAPMAIDTDTKAQPPAPSEIDQLTHLASSLMSLGDTDIYSKTYEHILRSLRSAGDVAPDWLPPSADVLKYEYKWDVPGAKDGEVFGPFGEEDMEAWYKAAYFGSGGEKVKVRKVGEEWGDWHTVLT